MRKKHKHRPARPDKGESEAVEMFAALKEIQRDERAARRSDNTESLLALEGLGFQVQPLTEYHFRINGVLDLFPTNRRFHNLRTGQRGSYNDVKAFVKKTLAQ